MSSKHNKLEIAIVEEFCPCFAPDAKLIYGGGMAQKNFVFDKAAFAKLDIPVQSMKKFPM